MRIPYDYGWEAFEPEGDFFKPTNLDFMAQPVEAYQPPAPVPIAAAPAPVAPAPLSLPSGWSTNFSDSVTLRGEEAPEVTPGSAYSFGVGDEELLKRLGFEGPVSYEERTGFGDSFETQQYLTPEAQKFIEQGNYQLAGKETPMGYYKTAFDPSGKALVDPVFTKTNYDNDPLTNAVWTALSVAAGNVMGPGMALVNAARAADSGDVLGALVSAAGGIGGLGGTVPQGVADAAKTAGQALGVARAIEQKDPLGLLASGAALTGTTNIGDVPVKDILNYGKVAQAIANEDVIGALGALGNVNKDFRVPEAIADPLNIASGLYQASQGSGAGLINAVRGIGKESQIGLSREEADFQDLLESLAPTRTPLPQTEDRTDYGAPPAPVVAAAPVQTDTYTEDFESAIPEPPEEEVAPFYDYTYESPAPFNEPVAEAPALSEPVITPEEVLTPEAIQQLIPEAPPEVIQQIIEQIAPQYTPEPEYAPEPVAEPPIEPVQQVEVTGAREPIVSPVSVEEILSQGVEPPPPLTLEQILGPALEAPPQQVEVTGTREPIYTPAPIPSPVSVEEILSQGVEQPTFTTLEDILPALQRVEVTGSREPEVTAPEAPRTFTATEGQVPSIEITGRREEPVYTPSPITNPVSVEEILNSGIEQPTFTTLEDILGPSAEVQRVETTGQREEPTPEPAIPETPRTFNVQEGEVPRIEITGNAGTPGTELATPIINVEDILREGIEQGPPPTIEEILGTEPVSAPSPAPAPAPSPSPAPAPAPAPKPSGPDYGALLAALMGALGNQQTKPEEYRVADVRRGVESGLRAIEGMYGSQDDLLRILRG